MFSAKRGDREYTVACADITRHERQAVWPALFWVNPPFRLGSLTRFQEQAAGTTHGIKYVEMPAIYQSIAAMLRYEDEFVWATPPSDKIVDFFSTLGIKTDFTWRKNAANGLCHLVYSNSLKDRINVQDHVCNRITVTDSKKDFSLLFHNGIGDKLVTIFDPCAGTNPLLEHALRLRKNYFGVEPNSMKCLNIKLLKNIMRKNGAEVTGIPEPIRSIPSGIVDGAPNLPKHIPLDELPDMTRGRVLGNFAASKPRGRR